MEKLLLSIPGGRYAILITMQMVFFILGCFLDPAGIIMICTPVFVPVIKSLGFDPLWFGVLFIMNMEMGYLTPPFGFNLFYMKAIAPPGDHHERYLRVHRSLRGPSGHRLDHRHHLPRDRPLAPAADGPIGNGNGPALALHFMKRACLTAWMFLGLSLSAILDHSADQFPENPAVIFRDRSLTYRELRTRTAAAAAGLAEIGVQQGPAGCHHAPELSPVYRGPLCHPEDRGNRRQCKPHVCGKGVGISAHGCRSENHFCPAGFFPATAGGSKADALENIILTDLDDAFTPKFGPGSKNDSEPSEYAGLLRRGSGLPLPTVPCDPEEVALLQYTGGTTGISKGAMLTHRNLIANVLQSVTWDRHAQKGRERMLTVLPFFHTYGITSCINASIYQAATIILLFRFEVDEVLDAIDRYQPTRMAGVPTMYIALASHPRIRESRISSIKVFSCGSAPFSNGSF